VRRDKIPLSSLCSAVRKGLLWRDRVDGAQDLNTEEPVVYLTRADHDAHRLPRRHIPKCGSEDWKKNMCKKEADCHGWKDSDEKEAVGRQ
jgi:hypothetical protein